jgi:flagellar biosynthesis protein FlhB
MNKNKTISDNQLRKAFRNISIEHLSSGFAENLMLKIEKEAVRQKRKKILIGFLQVAAGIVSILTLPVLAIYLCNLFIPEFSFSFSDVKIDFNPNSIIIGFAVLLLLIIDCLYRKFSHKDINRPLIRN